VSKKTLAQKNHPPPPLESAEQKDRAAVSSGHRRWQIKLLNL